MSEFAKFFGIFEEDFGGRRSRDVDAKRVPMPTKSSLVIVSFGETLDVFLLRVMLKAKLCCANL